MGRELWSRSDIGTLLAQSIQLCFSHFLVIRQRYNLFLWHFSGPTLFMVLTREDAVSGWRALMGPTDPQQALEVNPKSWVFLCHVTGKTCDSVLIITVVCKNVDNLSVILNLRTECYNINPVDEWSSHQSQKLNSHPYLVGTRMILLFSSILLSLRAQFGVDTMKNAVHGSSSVEKAKAVIEGFFPEVEILPDGTVAGLNLQTVEVWW